MALFFQQRTQKETQEIINWHYDEPYSFYDIEADKEDLAEFLDPSSWGNSYVVYDKEDELIGFFSFEQDGGIVEIGLGLRPDLTGQGIGFAFVKEGLAFAREQYSPQMFKLAVATFNERAMKVYEKAGFRKVRNFMQATNGGHYEFVEMIQET
ncbi:MAG TPA: GNAT family N-acetyltransferase [Bacillales bacterium]|nr:GNAT family N-acetyltransferase [Bacillales bacterium]